MSETGIEEQEKTQPNTVIDWMLLFASFCMGGIAVAIFIGVKP